ncbi:MAG: aminotransferase class IV [bacterium]
MKNIAFIRDKFVPFEEANLNIASSPVLYGLAVYTVFSFNWNEKKETGTIFRLENHYKRLVNSCKMMGFNGTGGTPSSPNSFEKSWPFKKFKTTMFELIKKNNPKANSLIRVSVFVDAIIAGTKINGLPIALSAYLYPMGQILPKDGINVCISSWRRNPDSAIPSRAKVNGGYVNASLMKNEAILNGYDDAIALDDHGHVTESTVANIFLIKKGVLVTPGTSADILEGITRDSILKIAEDLKIKTEERTVDRTELYTADEVFISGSSARIIPVVSVDKKAVGKSTLGPITEKLLTTYKLAQTTSPKYSSWRTEVK